MQAIHLLPDHCRQLVSVEITQFPLLRPQPGKQLVHLPLLFQVLQRGLTLMQMPCGFLMALNEQVLQVLSGLQILQRGLLTASGMQSLPSMTQPGKQATQSKGKLVALMRHWGLASTQIPSQRVKPLMQLKQTSPIHEVHEASGGELLGMHCPLLWQQTYPVLHLLQVVNTQSKVWQLGSMSSQLPSKLKQYPGSQERQQVPKSIKAQFQKTFTVGSTAHEPSACKAYPTQQEVQMPLQGSKVLQLRCGLATQVSLIIKKPNWHSAHLSVGSEMQQFGPGTSVLGACTLEASAIRQAKTKSMPFIKLL